jgi:multidrug resistance protein, MATE family
MAAKVVMYMALSEGLVISLTMTLLRNIWGYVYSDEEEIVTYISKMLPILGISFFIDGLHSSLSGGLSLIRSDVNVQCVTLNLCSEFAGVLTGCGKQKIGAAVNLGAFYLLGIPVAVLLAFVFHLNGMVLQWHLC